MVHSALHRLYPRAFEGRLPKSDPVFRVSRVKFFRAAALNLVLIQLLFLGLFCYLFGSLFQQVPRTHSLKVLWVDYDGGIIGDAVRDAYKTLQSNTFPTLVERPESDFPSQSDLRAAVCRTDYWAALYVSPGSSENLGLAISGSASQHNPSDVLTFIWNEARYPTVLDSAISSNLQALSNGARVAYVARNGTSAFSTIPSNNLEAISTFTNPWTLSSINIQPTIQGSRAIYNTIVIVLILIQCFFYLGTVNGLYVQFKIYTRISPSRIILVRALISGTFTMVGGLLISASIWAFKADWSVSGKQYALNWLTVWLFAHVNFLTLDVFTIWVPAPYVPMALITWVVINVSSVMTPFALSSPFYRWAYALPAHAVYEVLTDIWSSGCNPHLDFALPVLFVYEISGLCWTSLGVFKRCHFALVTEEAAQEGIRLRIEAALKQQREREMRIEEEEMKERTEGMDVITADSSTDGIAGQGDRRMSKARIEQMKEDEKDVEELENEIEEVGTRANRLTSFGPCFHVGGE
jgi:hypothetical protein